MIISGSYTYYIKIQRERYIYIYIYLQMQDNWERESWERRPWAEKEEVEKGGGLSERGAAQLRKRGFERDEGYCELLGEEYGSYTRGKWKFKILCLPRRARSREYHLGLGPTWYVHVNVTTSGMQLPRHARGDMVSACTTSCQIRRGKCSTLPRRAWPVPDVECSDVKTIHWRSVICNYSFNYSFGALHTWSESNGNITLKNLKSGCSSWLHATNIFPTYWNRHCMH